MGVMNTFVGILCVIVLLFLFYRENQRKDKRRIGWRMLATFSAVLGLYLLLVPIRCKQKQPPPGNIAILLTANYSQGTVEALQKKNPGATIINENSIWKINREIGALHIVGDGISYPLNDSIFPGTLVFHPNAQRSSLTAVHWNKLLIPGEPLTVQGAYRNTSDRPLRVLLSGFSTVVDSFSAPKGSGTFFLSAVPRVNGSAVYRIIVLDDDDTLENNAVPFEVISAKKPSVLLLSAYPDFENKFLQQWLSAAQYKVIGRTRISRQKFEKNFFNTDPIAVERLSTRVLDSTDIVIIDEEELGLFSNAEKNLLREYLSLNKIGLMIRADSASAGRHLFDGNTFAKVGSIISDSVEVEIRENDKKIVLGNSGSINYLKGAGDAFALISDSVGHMFAVRTLYGRGKLVFNVMPPVYPLMINGSSGDYGAIWSTLLQNATPQIEDSTSIFTSTMFPQIDLPMKVVVRAGPPGVPVVYADQTPMALAQHEWLERYYTGTYWPLNKGWQEIFSTGNRNFPVYIFDSADWEGIRAIESNTSTEKLINRKRNVQSLEKSENDYSSFPLSPVYWLVLFILGSVFLWIEKKIP
jgi:hypothetical protein